MNLRFDSIKKGIFSAISLLIGFISINLLIEVWYLKAIAMYCLFVGVVILGFKLVDGKNYKSYLYPFLAIFIIFSAINYLGYWFVFLLLFAVPIYRLWKYRLAMLGGMYLFINQKSYRTVGGATMLALSIFFNKQMLETSWRNRKNKNVKGKRK